ncbi:hypothetical protein ACFL96_05165 [Thermoproteota archaeon]
MNPSDITDHVKACQIEKKNPSFNDYEPFRILYEQGMIKPGSVITVKKHYDPHDVPFLVTDIEKADIMTTGEPPYLLEHLLSPKGSPFGWEIEL